MINGSLFLSPVLVAFHAERTRQAQRNVLMKNRESEQTKHVILKRFLTERKNNLINQTI